MRHREVADFVVTRLYQDYDIVIKAFPHLEETKELKKEFEENDVFLGIDKEDIIDAGKPNRAPLDEELHDEVFLYIDNKKEYCMVTRGWEVLQGNREYPTLSSKSAVWLDAIKYLGNPNFIVIYRDYEKKYRGCGLFKLQNKTYGKSK